MWSWNHVGFPNNILIKILLEDQIYQILNFTDSRGVTMHYPIINYNS